MNIFVLHTDPQVAASYLCDKHINKMIVESAQMLANCFTEQDLQRAPRTQSGNVRKHSFKHHPCSKWVLASSENAMWLVRHALAMDDQRYFAASRGDLCKYKEHFCIPFIRWCLNQFLQDKHICGNCVQTPFTYAIGPTTNAAQHPSFDQLDTVGKYRLYYQLDKPFATWKNRHVPHWYNQTTNITAA